MSTVLLIQVTDDQCEGENVWEHRVPLDTDKAKIMEAIAVFYPTASSVWLVVEEE